jgi:hypothetical protein
VDEVVAEDRHDHADRADDQDARVDADAAGQHVERLPGEHQVRGEEPDVHHHDEHDHDQRPVGAELAAGLHHLRHAEPRPLGAVQRHEDRADQVADHDGDHRQPERQPVNRGGQRPGDHREQHDVRAEPEAEQVTRLAVPLVERNRLDRLVLDALRRFGYRHDVLP